ncbi:hypothetical protein [Kribbella monticola]|uniref:hypothetical protein n=1 Tax=Kribbella monticola TaxID=2185285 RepID=UPI000DD406C5|nr:hypothetical protein [Kribbella monticola]
MVGRHKIAAAAGVLAGLFIVAATGAGAQAQTVAPSTAQVATARTDGAIVIHALKPTASTRTVTAAPSTYPAVERVFISGGAETLCYPGYACAVVPYGSGSYVFKFLHYDGYSLSQWNGFGYIMNNQTGSAAARWDNQVGGELGCVAPPLKRFFSWDPVYRIRLTAAAC